MPYIWLTLLVGYIVCPIFCCLSWLGTLFVLYLADSPGWVHCLSYILLTLLVGYIVCPIFCCLSWSGTDWRWRCGLSVLGTGTDRPVVWNVDHHPGMTIIIVTTGAVPRSANKVGPPYTHYNITNIIYPTQYGIMAILCLH